MAALCKRLYFNDTARDTYLHSELSEVNTHRDPDDCYFEADGKIIDSKLKKRRDLFIKDSAGNAPQVFVKGIITHDLSQLDHPLLPNLEIIIKLTMNPPERILMVGPEKFEEVASYTQPKTQFKLKLHSLAIRLRRPLCSEQELQRIERGLSANHPARYHFQKAELAWISMPANHSTFLSPEMFVNYNCLPSKLFIVFFEDKRLTGDYSKNIHRFSFPEKLNSITLLLDSRPVGNVTPPDAATVANGKISNIFSLGIS